VADKISDSLSGLVAAQCNANDPAEKAFAGDALRVQRLRIVLHVEQPQKVSRLFPRAIDPADVKSKLKKLLKAIDAHPMVVDQYSRPGNRPWTVTG
jgi:hypothetical protein